MPVDKKLVVPTTFSKLRFSEVQFDKLMDLCDEMTLPRSIIHKLRDYLVRGGSLEEILRFYSREDFDTHLDLVREIYLDAMKSTIPINWTKGGLTEEQFTLLLEFVVIPNQTTRYLNDYFCKDLSVDIDENFIQWADLLRVAARQINDLKAVCKDDTQHKKYLA
jgi:hypothetical protein